MRMPIKGSKDQEGWMETDTEYSVDCAEEQNDVGRKW